MKKNLFLWSFLFIFLTTYNSVNIENTHSNFFAIKTIEIKGSINSDKEELKERFEKLKKKNIIFINKKDFQEVIKEINFVSSINIKKIYPDKIIATITENMPIGIYLNDDGRNDLLLENNKTIKNYNYTKDSLPTISGEGAQNKFFKFYLTLKKTSLNLKSIKKFYYYDINRWDILLKDEKLIKLPVKNYEESILKFLQIYKENSFKQFKIFDFRISDELIVR